MTRPGPDRLAMIADIDGWRGPLHGAATGLGGREWQHFVVFGPGFSLLSNLSLEPDGAGRVITLFDGETPAGQVTTCRAPALRPGKLDATFGDAGMRLRDGAYEIWQHGAGVRCEARLEPTSTPSLSHHIRLGQGAHLSWCLVPRLRASGWVEVAGERTTFDGVPGYHDHNWGRFAWGGDFSWEWGCVVPDDRDSPWTVIFARMCDRALRRTTATSVFLLRDGEHLRYFRDAEARFEVHGALSRRAAPRIPPAAALLLPDADVDVPAALRFEARRGEDTLLGEIAPVRRAQVLVPADDDLRRVARLNEVHARAHVEGRCAGDAVRVDGTCLFEVMRG